MSGNVNSRPDLNIIASDADVNDASLFQEARAVFMSVLDDFADDCALEEILQRRWPTVPTHQAVSSLPIGVLKLPVTRTEFSEDQPSTKRRRLGSLHSEPGRFPGGVLAGSVPISFRDHHHVEPSQTNTNSAINTKKNENKNEKNKKKKSHYANEYVVLDPLPDGSLPLPAVPNVTDARIKDMIFSIQQQKGQRKCGQCTTCTGVGVNAPSQSTRCKTIAAIQAWDEAWGSITFDAIRTIIKQVSHQPKTFDGRPNQRFKYTFGAGNGVRCGLCKTCRRETSYPKYACMLVRAILQGDTLPERLNTVLKREIEQQQEYQTDADAQHHQERIEKLRMQELVNQRISLKEYVNYVMSGRTLRQQTINDKVNTTEIIVDDDKEEREVENDSNYNCSDDDYDGDDVQRWAAWAPFLFHHHGGGKGDGSRSNRGPLPHPKYIPNSSNDNDYSRIPVKQQVQRLANSLDIPVDQLSYWTCHAQNFSELTNQNEECGHLNSTNIYACDKCKTLRWDGPLGQLRARVLGVIQTGGLITVAGQSLDVAQSELASIVAARIIAESGNDINFLFSNKSSPGGNEEEEGEEEDDMNRFISHVEFHVAQVLDKLKESQKRNTMSRNLGNVGTRGGDDVISIGKDVLRRSQMAKACVKLENAMMRLAEEQSALMMRKLEKYKNTEDTKEKKKESTTSNSGMDALLKLKQLFLSASASLSLGRSSSLREPSLQQTLTVGSTKFQERLQCAQENCIPAHMVDLLYCHPLNNRWNEHSLSVLIKILQEVPDVIDLLQTASTVGGPSLFRAALHAMMIVHEETPSFSLENLLEQEQSQQISQQNQQLAMAIIPTQQSQQHTFASIPVSQRTDPPFHSINNNINDNDNNEGEDVDAAADDRGQLQQWAAGIALLESFIDSLAASTATATATATTLQNESVIGRERGEDEPCCTLHDQTYKRLHHICSSTNHFMYGLTHSILNSIALKVARAHIPSHLVTGAKTVLEAAKFPAFPPLPPSPQTYLQHAVDLSDDTFDDMVVKPRPESQPAPQLAQTIANENARKRRKERSGVVSGLEREHQVGITVRGFGEPNDYNSAFHTWVPSQQEQEEIRTEEERNVHGLTSAMSTTLTDHDMDTLIKQCPADVQLVWKEAMKAGVKQQSVASALIKYLQTTNMVGAR